MFRFWVVAVLFAFAFEQSQGADRYVAMFEDGVRVEANEIQGWNDQNSQTKIGDRVLFDPGNHLRWMIDREQPVGVQPTMYVEFGGGDRLAGEVMSFANGLENPYEMRPQYLVVKPMAHVHPPELSDPVELHVTMDWIQRIVWDQVGSDELQPGNLWLRTGASVGFRSLRWTQTGVTVLTNDGVKQFLISELGELHLPKIDPWTAYGEQAVSLSPDGDARLIQLIGNDGSRWTTSSKRFQPRSSGDRNRPEQWYLLIQPAWSLTPIWLRFRTIHEWRSFVPTEVPLSNFVPDSVKHQAVFGHGLDWQINLNVQRGMLQSLNSDFGWGFGVHGSSELVFELPSHATAIRTKYGLDRSAGDGGCVNVEIIGNDGQSLTKHLNLVGSETVGEMDWQNLTIDRNQRHRITFRTEMAHEGRPKDADPFDIRDLLNWYEPEVRLDLSSQHAETTARSIRRLPGLVGWTISTSDVHSLKTKNVLDVSDPYDPQFRVVVRSVNRSWSLSRTAKIGDHDAWLAIVASRFESHSNSAIEVRIDGRGCGEFDVPVRVSMTDPEPILVPVEQYQGRKVSIELIVHSSDDESWIDWRGFSLSKDRPGILTIFEDDDEFAFLLNPQKGIVTVDGSKPYSGAKSLGITPESAGNPMIPGLNAWICEFPRLGQYRYFVFAWKKTTGTKLQLQLAERGRFGDGHPRTDGAFSIESFLRSDRRIQTADDRGRRFRYCYEQGVATTQSPVPLWMNGDLPRDWQLVQRDLFSDFGMFAVTGISLNCVDGDEARFDHIYLARTKPDLEYLANFLTKPQPATP